MLPLLSEYMNTKKPKILMLCFQKYWWLKNPAIWLDEKPMACNWKTYGMNWKIFQFSIFLIKNDDNISRKLKKSLFWTGFEQVLLILGQRTIFLEKLYLPIFSVSRFLLLCKILGKNYSASFKRNWSQTERTDGQASIHRTCRPPKIQNRSATQLPYIWIRE